MTPRTGRARVASSPIRSNCGPARCGPSGSASVGRPRGRARPRTSWTSCSTDPAGALADKVADRNRIDRRTVVDLPGNRLLADSVRWSKQMLAASVQQVDDLNLRWVEAGKRYPPPTATLDSMRWLGAGWPDYTWLFGTDGEYTAFAAVAAGQFEPIKDHLRALRDVSVAINPDSGKIVHEVTPDGAVYFGADDDPGNTDESSKYPSAVALVWRWTGDEAFMRDLYPASQRAMEFVAGLDEDEDGWPEGLGNVERPGNGRGEAGQRGLRDPRVRGSGRPRQGCRRHPDPPLGGRQGAGPAAEVRGGLVVRGRYSTPTPTRWTIPATRRSSSGTGSG